jgi:serine/threonine-protein kinase
VDVSEVAPDSGAELVGQVVLGRYRIVRPLARGGMGVVYLGRVEGAAGFSKPVVIKSVLTVLGGERETEKLFAREARIVANLQHPNIVAVIDFGKVHQSYVMVLEYVHGYHLGQWLRYVTETRGRLPVEQAVHVMLAVLEALTFAHGVSRPDGTALGIVHRDISPANVLMDLQGHVKLSDFGIARSADDDFKTQKGLFRGTLPYSAPEALQGESESPKIDQYACAVVLYQLILGKNPFKGKEPAETVARVLTHVPPPLSALRDDVPSGIDAAVARALSKDPAERFDSVADFSKGLVDGCEWSERDAALVFTKQIEMDFNDVAMAEHLGLESLVVRDAAWREAQDVSTGRRLSLSSSPPGVARDSGAKLLLEQVKTIDPGQVDTARVGRTVRDEVPTPVVPAAPASGVSGESEIRSDALARDAATSPSQRRLWLFVLLAALAAGAGAAAVIGLIPRGDPPAASRVLVIEKHETPPSEIAPPDPDAVAEPVPSAGPVPEPSASSPGPSAGPPAAVRGGPAPGRGALLARAFQRQEGKIQRCFQENAGALQGDPRISVRFQIDATGVVENAVVAPSSVAGSPLGACLLGVARATRFGPQPEPISFSIPIAARVVKR